MKDPKAFYEKKRTRLSPEPVICTIRCLQCDKSVEVNYPSEVGRKRFCGPRCRSKWVSATQRGENNPMWIDGRTALNQRPPAISAAWRMAILERDDYTCQECGQRGGALQADHIKPYTLYPDIRWELSNGRTLCVPCHKATPTYGGRMKKQMQNQTLGRI